MAELRCKPGDLAIVTRCAVEQRVGLLVHVVRRDLDHGYDWLVEFQGPGAMGRDIQSNRLRLCRFGLMRDWNLTPIRGDELSDQEDANEVLYG